MPRSHIHAQHFLRSPRLVAELIGHSNLRKNDLVYDLGAGSGVITNVLARRVRSVIAVEVEPQSLANLRKNVGHLDNVTILRRDILQLRPPEEPYKIFANIPFNLSSPIVRHFSEHARPPKAMYLIVQRQFARKLVPGSDHFTSELGAALAPLYVARIRRPLRRSDFTPPPGVDTVLLELKLRETPLLPSDQLSDYRAFISRCFAEQKFFASTNRALAAISPELRPSQLTPEQWLALWRTT